MGISGINGANYRAALESSEKSSIAYPASPLAIPSDMAKTQAQATVMLTANTFPTHDNIYTISSIAIRVARSGAGNVSGIASSWGIKY